MKLVLMPKQNERDLDDVPKEVKDELDIRLISTMDEILPLALLPPLPSPSVPPPPSDDDAPATP